MISSLLFLSAVRRWTSAMVGWWVRIRTVVTRCRAALAFRCPLRFRQCLLVLATQGRTERASRSLAKAASKRIHSGAVTSEDEHLGRSPAHHAVRRKHPRHVLLRQPSE